MPNFAAACQALIFSFLHIFIKLTFSFKDKRFLLFDILNKFVNIAAADVTENDIIVDLIIGE